MRVGRTGVGVLVALLLTGTTAGCSSDDDDAAPTSVATTAPSGTTGTTGTAAPTSPPPGVSVASAPTSSEAPPSTVAGASSTTAPTETSASPTTTVAPSPVDTNPIEDADAIVLSDGFGDDDEEWDPSTWQVDVPGEAESTSSDGAGVMRIDRRGTHEWVRAVATESVHTDAGLVVRVRPVESSQGTVFVGLHGDGEWQDATQYLPQSGVAVEYGFADIYLGEITLIVFDGTDAVRFGPVTGPVLDDGESADIRFEVVDGRARVMVWRTGEDPPTAWQLEADVESDGGVVQLAYRDGTASAVAWDEVTLYTL